MKRLMTLLLMCLIGITASAQSAEKLYNDGKELYEAKRYEAAFPKLKAAAEKGHKKAQYRLGRCYDKGRTARALTRTSSKQLSTSPRPPSRTMEMPNWPSASVI